MLPDAPLLLAFLAASVLLAVTPGPGVLYIVARSASQGRRAGLASVAGVALGNLGNAIEASLGLAALFALSSAAFTIVKFAGAAYLIYLGVQALRVQPVAATAIHAPLMNRVFRDGFIVALLNPKTTLFFAAFLPQFMRADVAPIVQSMLLGALFVAIAAVTDCAYALAAGYIAPRLNRIPNVRHLGRWFTAMIFIGLGILAALSSQRISKS